MSQSQNLFSAQAKVTPIAATTVAPVIAVVLACSGDTVRVVNEGSSAAFLAIGDRATDVNALATLPTAGSVTSCYVAPNADFTLSIPGIPGGDPKYASAVTRTGTAQLQLYVGSGS